jgi:hypothetical protein
MLIIPVWNYNKILDNISTKQNLRNTSSYYRNVEYFDQTNISTTRTAKMLLGNNII